MSAAAGEPEIGSQPSAISALRLAVLLVWVVRADSPT